MDELLEWIKDKRPTLLHNDENRLKKFREAEIIGQVFLTCVGDRDFFQKECNLPAGPSVVLAILSRELAEGEAVSIKSKLLSFMSCTPRRQQANNVTGNRQQAEDV